MSLSDRSVWCGPMTWIRGGVRKRRRWRSTALCIRPAPGPRSRLWTRVTGKLLWQFDPKVAGAVGVKACCDVVNRGAAYWNGKVYIGAIDGRLIAVDAKTGQQVWSTQTTDPSKNYTITGAPRVVKGRVIIGNGGADLGVRGYVSAYEAESGTLAWRFYIVPGKPGVKDGAASDAILEKLAAKTWAGHWWDEAGGGGGGTAWDSMAYDPDLDLLYIGTGNSGYWNKKFRSPGDGDDLFVASILALRPQTGEYVWHFQEVPGEEWDYTSTAHMILTDLVIDGTTAQGAAAGAQRRRVLRSRSGDGESDLGAALCAHQLGEAHRPGHRPP